MFFKEEVLSKDEYTIRTFANTYYPDLILHRSMLDQLLWLQSNTINTSQSSVAWQEEPVNIEVKRVLSRLYCFNLFVKGGNSSYQLFIAAQPEGIALSESDFNTLSKSIQNLSPVSLQCLMATCFITKSDQALLEIPAEERSKVPGDSEQFITHMVTHHPHIFPINRLLNQESISLLQSAFLERTHMRHMLDMEGGYNMIVCLRKAMQTRDILYEDFELWYARWILNIAGLDGHTDTRGSSYLTQPVAACIFALKSELDQLWINADYPVLERYLDFRQGQLEASNHYVAYLGALMREYTPEAARDIQDWFANCSVVDQDACQDRFRAQQVLTKVTPSFKPTVLVNLRALGCSVAEALTLFIQVESQIMQAYEAAIANGMLRDTIPISYRMIADKKCLAILLSDFRENGYVPDLEISAEGLVSMADNNKAPVVTKRAF